MIMKADIHEMRKQYRSEVAVLELREKIKAIILAGCREDESGWAADNLGILLRMSNEVMALPPQTRRNERRKSLMSYLLKMATKWYNDGKMNGIDWCAFEREFDRRLYSYKKGTK